MAGLAIVLTFGLMAIGAQWITPYGADQQLLADRLEGALSRASVWHRRSRARPPEQSLYLVSQISLRVGVFAVALSLLTGVTPGLIVGYLAAGSTPGLFMRGMDDLCCLSRTTDGDRSCGDARPRPEMALGVASAS